MASNVASYRPFGSVVDVKNGKNYQPPLAMTPAIFEMVDGVEGKIGRLAGGESRAERLRAVHSSLAIEGNPLSEEQVAAIWDGRVVSASSREIREVQNAFAAYERLEGWAPHAETDLLAAHGIFMDGLLDDAGRYRRVGARIASGPRILHVAPPPERVPELMDYLLDWLRSSELHPLVSSAVFHYEFEFIHPFADGSGRMGRMWHKMILCDWNPSFAFLPLENALYVRQGEYFAAIKRSTRETNAAPFVEFVLSAILALLDSPSAPRPAPKPDAPREGAVREEARKTAVPPVEAEPPAPPREEPAPSGPGEVPAHVARLLEAVNGELSGLELQGILGLRDRKSFRERYLGPALQAEFIEMTVPDKPNSRLQKYRLTEKGRDITHR